MSRSKYKNRMCEMDGHIFDSMAERDRYIELKLLQRAGEIAGLELQPAFVIHDAYVYRGRKMREIKYIADFLYVNVKDGKTCVEDVKGKRTDVYMIKRKLFLRRYGDVVEFREVEM